MPDTGKFASRRFLLVVLDLAGFARLAGERADVDVAAMLHEYYGLCQAAVGEAGGRVVKYMGDAVLAAFDPERTERAVSRVVALREEVAALTARHGMATEVGGNLHLADVAVGEFGPDARFDVVGAAVNRLFRMGHGPGLRITEAVRDALPGVERARWFPGGSPGIFRLGS